MARFNMNVFQVVVVASALFASIVSAQQTLPPPGGRMTLPVPMQGNKDVVGYSSSADGCGVSVGEEFKYTVAQQSPTTSIYPGQVMTINYMASGSMGFGPIYVRFDSTGVGAKYDYMAQMKEPNLPGVNGYLAQSPSGYLPYQTTLSFTVPQNIQCNKNGMCLMQVLNQQAYVSCTYVKLTAGPVSTPGDANSGANSLYGGSLVQAKLERLEALVDILKNLGVDAKVLYQANFDVADLTKRLVSIIN